MLLRQRNVRPTCSASYPVAVCSVANENLVVICPSRYHQLTTTYSPVITAFRLFRSVKLPSPLQPQCSRCSWYKMSIVTIQVGQCGNQLGSSLFNALHHHSCDPILTADSTKPGDRKSGAQSGSRTDDDASAEASACRRSFFRNKGTVARAVVVDTEPKVIQQIIARGVIGLRASQGDGTQTRSAKSRGEESGVGGSHWSYDSGTQVCCHAQGGAANNWAYGYHRYGARFTEACLEGVRREAERCDHLAGLCVLHSAAGGTGSGLGTFLTEVRN